jgi:hypothetical protein
MLASPLLIQGKSRMRKRACTDLCGGQSAMVVPTATVNRGTLGFRGGLRVLRRFCYTLLIYVIQKLNRAPSFGELIKIASSSLLKNTVQLQL